MNDSFTKEQVLAAYNSAPDFVRAVFNDEKTTQILMGLQSRLQLHIDEAGTLGKEVGYLLLGLTDPSKFANRLKNIGFSEQAVTEIMTEINQKIFVPLREKMMKGAGNAQQPVKSTEPVKPIQPRNESFMNPTPANPRFSYPAVAPSVGGPVRQQQTFTSVPKYAPTSRLAEVRQPTDEGGSKYFHLENKIPIPPAVPQNGLASALKQVLHTDEKLLEDHEEPHIDIGASSSPRWSSGEVGSGIIPPGVRFSPIAHEVQPSPVIPKVEPPVPPAPPKPVPPIVPASARPYSTDPYREPIDEK